MKRLFKLVLGLFIFVFLIAQISFAQPSGDIPKLDLSKHTVELSEIYFDTFQRTNRAVPLTDASPELIERLRDAIPPITNPNYESIAEAKAWLKPDDDILGYSVNGQAWAYPIRILNFHEIVNEVIAEEPILISYCPLCYSGIVYSRKLNGQTLSFGNTSALYDSDMVMLDYETGSYWWQVAGKAIVGTLSGETLEPLPSTLTSFAEWQELHPNSLVLSRDTGFDRPYERDAFSNYPNYVNEGNFAFPVTKETEQLLENTSLEPATRVLAVKLNQETKAYPLEKDVTRVVHDQVGAHEIVVFQQGLTAAAFLTEKRFEFSEGSYIDLATNSVWSVDGQSLSGALEGEMLEALPVKTTFWFAMLGAEPDIQIYDSP